MGINVPAHRGRLTTRGMTRVPTANETVRKKLERQDGCRGKDKTTETLSPSSNLKSPSRQSNTLDRRAGGQLI
ncbi:hypothetical protein SESBI_50932 [Sesbania bispinosa]|nr:hypothetical protein SESBI_50932 [Sesbania bispinosa]